MLKTAKREMSKIEDFILRFFLSGPKLVSAPMLPWCENLRHRVK
jgi:hypothetical protein